MMPKLSAPRRCSRTCLAATQRFVLMALLILPLSFPPPVRLFGYQLMELSTPMSNWERVGTAWDNPSYPRLKMSRDTPSVVCSSRSALDWGNSIESGLTGKRRHEFDFGEFYIVFTILRYLKTMNGFCQPFLLVLF